MKMKLHAMTYLVRDYDEAIAWFTSVLGFELVEDTDLGQGKRWVLVQPPGGQACLLLARAATPIQENAVGNQTGDRVMLFLHTDDFWRDYTALKDRAVIFDEMPREEPYGTVVVFRDLYNQKWDLIQPK